MSNLSLDQVKRINYNFLKSLEAGDASKEASLMNQSIVLKTLREDGFSRKYLQFEPITPMDLEVDFQNPDILTKFVPVENPADSYLAMSTDWLHPTKDIWYQSEFFRIRFFPMVSRKLKMTEQQILAAKYPIREYVEGLIKNDFLAIEDFQFIDNLERMLAQQSILFGGNNVITSTNTKLLLSDIADLNKAMIRQKMATEVFILNEATYQDFLKHNNSEAGSLVQKELYDTGLMTPNRQFRSFAGHKFLLTNNADIVPEKVVYALPPVRMLGKFYQLQMPQMYIKFDKHILEMYARQILGRGIANIKGVAKLVLA